MKILFTCPIPEKDYQAGKVYEVSDGEAQIYIDAQKAIQEDSSDSQSSDMEYPEKGSPKKQRQK